MRTQHLPPAILGPSLALLLAAGSAFAQDAEEPQDLLVAEAGDGTGNSGRIAVNMAAGSQNQQLSSAVLAQGDIAIGSEAVTQRMQTAPGDRATAIRVEGDAFSGNSGMTSINLTAGTQNQSANLAILAIGAGGAISDQLLEQSSAPIEPSAGIQQEPADPNDSVAVSEGAFGDGSGLLQVNLIGGERNSSANTFSLNASAGG